jgi:type III secretion protein J
VISVRIVSLSSLQTRWLWRRHGGCLLALVAGVLLAGCNADLYSGLDQRQGNEIAAALIRHGIPTERSTGKDGRMTVSIDRDRFAEAIAVLNDAGLPKEEFATLGDVFKKEGLVSSPLQERAQMVFALSQELSRTVSEIDGVLSARVHLVLPENDPLRQELIPSSASVFIRSRSDAPVDKLVPQIKMLIANGVAGLSYDKVSVVLVPVDVHRTAADAEPELTSFYGLWIERDSIARARWMFYGLITLVLLSGGALAALVSNPRWRVYLLPPLTTGKWP